MNTIATNTFDVNCDSNCADPCSPGCTLGAFTLNCGTSGCNSCFCIIPIGRNDGLMAVALREGLLVLRIRSGEAIRGALISA
jgi:hypothetical protein